ncbi:hypothetical protein RND81_08G072000 [Saponaria officinalis]|uniref:Uncharacterized protein n=1 Tax=Saponaria officinalis TaxID=3572 RepID=A0AAW1J532_SAPOF
MVIKRVSPPILPIKSAISDQKSKWSVTTAARLLLSSIRSTPTEGDNVPAPYMTFEAAGFSPEILSEVRYLLQWGAYVVRCTAMSTLYVQQVFFWRLHNGLWSLPYHNSSD